MSDAAANQLAVVGNTLTALTGTPWVFSGRDKARSFTFGAKVLMPVTSSVHPYVGGGFGALNVRRTISEQSRGNVTQAYLAQFGSPDAVIDPTNTDTTHPMGELRLVSERLSSERMSTLGIATEGLFTPGTQSFDISQVGASVGVKF
jgi:hypothetical protein